MTMQIQIIAEYACGHEPRAIVSGTADQSTFQRDVARMVKEASPKGSADFNCHCGRGAAFVEILVDGEIFDRSPASAFTTSEGSRLTVFKDGESGGVRYRVENGRLVRIGGRKQP